MDWMVMPLVPGGDWEMGELVLRMRHPCTCVCDIDTHKINKVESIEDQLEKRWNAEWERTKGRVACSTRNMTQHMTQLEALML